MQSRIHGLIINKYPLFLASDTSPDNYLIVIPDINLQIPLYLAGFISYFPVWKLTGKELYQLPIVHMTCPIKEWNPSSDYFQEQEKLSVLSSSTTANIEVDQIYILKLDQILNHHNTITMIKGLFSRRKLQIQASQLDSRWNIDIATAMKTLQSTT